MPTNREIAERAARELRIRYDRGEFGTPTSVNALERLILRAIEDSQAQQEPPHILGYCSECGQAVKEVMPSVESMGTNLRSEFTTRSDRAGDASAKTRTRGGDDTRELLRRFVDKLKIILPKVDGFISLASLRAGQDLYDGPNLAEEMKEAERLLAQGEPR